MSTVSGFISGYLHDSLEVYFSETDDLKQRPEELENFLSEEERLRAGKFHFQDDRETYISSHAMLRMVISDKLGSKTSQLIFTRDSNNKPQINGRPVHFNLTHTKRAFAFVISPYHYVGIDMEEVNRSLDFKAIMKTHFSLTDQRFVEESAEGQEDRFMLLWTRKESLLKALGVGLVTDLSAYDVSTEESDTEKSPFSEVILTTVRCINHYIYSARILNYYLSIASPLRSKVIIKRL
jgi:4'-phosphopantetheinyl transferase